MDTPNYDLIIKRLPLSDYQTVWRNMQQFTAQRCATTVDEIWLVEHYPIFTLGQNGSPEHLLTAGESIQVINTDRGGQITYHGPGQLIAYILVDIKRKNLGVKQLVTLLEQSLISLLAQYSIKAYAKPNAPGVYVDDAKIGAIGLRIRKGCSYHGLSFNLHMDLSPFGQINPCGYKDLAITQLCDLIEDEHFDKEWVLTQLIQQLLYYLGYQQPLILGTE